MRVLKFSTLLNTSLSSVQVSCKCSTRWQKIKQLRAAVLDGSNRDLLLSLSSGRIHRKGAASRQHLWESLSYQPPTWWLWIQPHCPYRPLWNWPLPLSPKLKSPHLRKHQPNEDQYGGPTPSSSLECTLWLCTESRSYLRGILSIVERSGECCLRV